MTRSVVPLAVLFLALVLAGCATSAPIAVSTTAPTPTTIDTSADTTAPPATLPTLEPTTLERTTAESTIAESTPPSGVSGTVMWPDGTPARNVIVELYPSGYPYAGQSGGERLTTDGAGRYSIDSCPCSDLGGSFLLPPGGGQNWDDGGNQCILMMHTQDGSLTTAAEPGTTVNWTMLDMPCSRDYLLPRIIDQEIAAIQSDPQQLGGGSWQAARARSS